MEWLPSREAALSHLDEFLESAGSSYARTRNYDFGRGAHTNVSCLSPWIRHRILTEREVIDAVVAVHSKKDSDKFVSEVLWRTYWKGWLERRPFVWQSYKAGLVNQKQQLGENKELQARFDKAVSAESGIECFDAWVVELVETGYLHNHARMWFASIWIFTLKLPWELGADFFMFHLLDGDPASNTLSWRWVAGLHTKDKHYLATAGNIEKFTDARFNPVGALDEQAVKLQWQEILPAVDPPTLQTPSRGLKSTLLVTSDDLCPAFLLGQVDVSSVLFLGSVEERSAKVQSFQREAMKDASRRLSAIIDGNTQPAIHEVEPQAQMSSFVDKLVAAEIQQVVTPYIPVGANRELLDQLQKFLLSVNITLVAVQREWDNQAWPHCAKGFFHFKKSIMPLV